MRDCPFTPDSGYSFTPSHFAFTSNMNNFDETHNATRLVSNICVQTMTTNEDRTTQIFPAMTSLTQHPISKRRCMQTDKISTRHNEMQTNEILKNNSTSQYDSPNQTCASVMTDHINGIDSATLTEPPCSRHMQTVIVKTKSRSVGPDTESQSTKSETDPRLKQQERLRAYGESVKHAREQLRVLTNDVAKVAAGNEQELKSLQSDLKCIKKDFWGVGVS